MAQHVKAPAASSFDPCLNDVAVFLAGSIEMGTAEKWQDIVASALMDSEVDYIFNPRRDDWDSSWEQSIDNPQFYAQVTWELDHIEKSNVVFFYFDPATKSPITLLELGVVLGTAASDVVVVCPPGFWRKGNIDILCHRYNIPVHESLDEGIKQLKSLF